MQRENREEILLTDYTNYGESLPEFLYKDLLIYYLIVSLNLLVLIIQLPHSHVFHFYLEYKE